MQIWGRNVLLYIKKNRGIIFEVGPSEYSSHRKTYGYDTHQFQ